MADVTAVLVSMYPVDKAEPGMARPAAVGAIVGMRPEVSVVVSWPHADFDRLWTLNTAYRLRNYVMQPYQMVKDLRTREQTGDVNRVLDGDIDQFIKAYLTKKAAGALLVPTDDDIE